MKIKAKNPGVRSMDLIVPVNGLIHIDDTGIAEVSNECAEVLVNHTNDWEYLDTESKEKETAEEKGIEEKDEPSDREKLVAQLSELTFAEMKSLAAESGFDESEYGKLNSKKLMTAYLLKKFDEAEE